MQEGYIMHRAAANECYALDEESLVISVRTGYDVDAVELCYGDPYSAGILGGGEQWTGTPVPMERDGRLKYQQIWSVTVRPEYKRCKYYFILHAGEETVCLLEDGCYSREKMALPGKQAQYFIFPWMNPSDLFVTPDWAADTIWYQIFPDRFCNGDPKRNPPYIKPWKCEKTSCWDLYGGDLRGICEKIPYLKELGITGIYLTPVFVSKSNHKYNTMDYKKIDEAFGTEQDLKDLTALAHQAGIRVMLDAVFNHCGTDFAPWRDVLERGPESEYFDWFMIHRWPFDPNDSGTRDKKYDSFAFCGGMPKLNTGNEAVVSYFTELCGYWLREWGIDGIRFDVGNEVSHSFLKHLRRELKKINPDVYLLGEIWHDAIGWLLGDEYDSVMNYPFAQSIQDFYLDPTLGAEDFACGITRCYHMYYRQTNRVLFNLLDSHDTDRLFTRAGSLGTFYQQLAILFTMEGSPCIYYGTETAMPGGHDPDCRRCMPWQEIEEGRFLEQTEAVKKLISIRKEHPAAKSRHILWKRASDNERVIWYEKTAESDAIGVILNASEKNYDTEVLGETLFSYGYEHETLKIQGLLIYRKL